MVSPKVKKRVYSGNFCQAPGCSNQSGKDKELGIARKYHRFPGKEKKSLSRRRAWLRAIPRENWSPKKNHRICSDHFIGGAASHVAGHPAFVPTIFKGADKVKGKVSPKKRQSRTSSQASEIAVTPPFETPKTKTSRKRREMGHSSEKPSTGRPICSRRLGVHSQQIRDSMLGWKSADHDYESTTRLHYVQTEVEHYQTLLEEERSKFEFKLITTEQKTLSLDSVKDFRMWTNFPNRQVFDAVASYLKSRGGDKVKYWRGGETVKYQHHADKCMKKPGPERKMSYEEELFLVVVKLKSGLNNTELAQLFGISDTVVCQIFTTHLNFMCQEFKLLFEMPPLDEEGVADCFKKWEDLMVVLDCTELAVEKSSSLLARKQMYSNYKGRDTVKFGVSLGRNLCVNYVSKAYGGRASDKFITMESQEMLNALPPGCKVMTDRGFNVGQELKEMGVELIIPTFKGRDRTQMTQQELSSSENIAMARIHVERIIQRIRTYQILAKPVKLSSKDLIEQIFTVCSYLTNFQLPIIRLK